MREGRVPLRSQSRRDGAGTNPLFFSNAVSGERCWKKRICPQPARKFWVKKGSVPYCSVRTWDRQRRNNVTAMMPATIQTSRLRNMRSEDQPRFDAAA